MLLPDKEKAAPLAEKAATQNQQHNFGINISKKQENLILEKWIATEVGSACNYYTSELKWHIFPVHGIVDGRCTCGEFPCGKDNRNAGKHPACNHWLEEADDEIETVHKRFKGRSDYNVGLACGGYIVWVLDIDYKNDGHESLEKLEKIYGKLPATYVVKTGNGLHYYFKKPKGITIPSKSKNAVPGYPGIDTRGKGGYVVAPPSIHFSGNKYQAYEGNPEYLAEAPEWLIEKITKDAPKETPKETFTKAEPLFTFDRNSGATPEWSVDEVWRMLDKLDPDMGYDDWLRSGMALHEGGYSLDIWDGWSSGGSKYKSGECEKKWRTFHRGSGVTMGTLVDMAKLNGWHPQHEARVSDTSNVSDFFKKAKENASKGTKKEPPKEPPQRPRAGLSFDPLQLPGLIGDTVRWITEFAPQKQPELALLNTLAFAGAIFGRRYRSRTNIRTNIYAVGTGDTATGKEHSRQALIRLAHASGLDEFIGANSIRSDTGVLKSMVMRPSQMMMLDEFGRFLKAMGDNKSPHHIKMVSQILLTLYGASSGVYNHGEIADPRSQPIVIQYPNLCIYGTDTEASYIPALKKVAIENGELNRFIILAGRNERSYPDREILADEMDDALSDKWRKFSKLNANGNLGLLVNSSTIAPDPITVDIGECEEIFYNFRCAQIDILNGKNPMKMLWGRYYENITKIALIFAIARDMENPVFIPEDFEIGRKIVDCSTSYISYLAEGNMADSPYEESLKKILAEIKKRGGSGMSRTELFRTFRIKKREIDDIINALMEEEAIFIKDKVVMRGRAPIIYMATS